ncbi:MAG: choline transporter [Candidatus Rokuibacteriota bacterium]|nr:MAG: choline transporter [Candidatus Rokubacteria bacterium]
MSTLEPVDPPLLEAAHLSRVAGGVRLVDDVTMRVRRREVLAVVGPSGSGKSSFLRLLNRLDEPTSGTVYLEGRDYRLIPPRELRCRVGILFPGTTGDNLRFGPRQRGQELGEEAVAFLLEKVGLAGRAGSDVRHLSGGEAQRVSVARALANDPAVLLLDEPTSALDDAAKQDVETLIRKIVREQELTCLLVTHDQAQAGRLASRVMVLAAGKLARIGATDEVLRAEDRLH